MQRDNTNTKKRQKLSRQEIRTNRIFAAIIIVLAVAGLAVIVMGMYSNFKNGFPKLTTNPFIFFSDPVCNTALLILLAVIVVVIFCYILWTPKDRKEAKDSLTKSVNKAVEQTENRLGLRKGIIVDPSLKAWEKSVSRMCKNLNIRHAAVLTEAACEENMNGKIAFSAMSREGIPAVVISTKAIDRWSQTYSPQMVYDMVRFVLGHELAHIRYRDYSSRNAALRAGGCLILAMGAVFLGAYGIGLLAEAPEALMYACLIILCMGTVFAMRTFLTIRYWKCVSEYRADRIAYTISGASDTAAETILGMSSTKDNENHRKRKKRGVHPEAEDRIKELKRKKPWTVSEYFRYACRMLW